ncbi:hypothetical protein DFJ74DRAFT_219578 [Hyaloraphidium curvatum]|nr:hypothetical protein DFJ74DRAFT_219578 [Hyaloraphidium curvatum]
MLGDFRRVLLRLAGPALAFLLLWSLTGRPVLHPSGRDPRLNGRLGPYSTVRCTGTEDPRHRRCHFRNVCVNRTSGRIKFYRVPSHADVPLVDSDFSTGLPKPLAYLRAQIPANFSIAVDVTYEHLPSADFEEMEEDVALIYEPFWPANFGHALGDDFFPFWRLIRRFKLLGSPRGYRLLLTGIHWYCNGTRDERYDAEFYEGCLRLRLLSSLFSAKLDTLRRPISAGLTCMRNLVVGTEAYGMRNDDDGLFEEFVDQVLVAAGYPRLPTLSSLRVGILHKRGRRTITNILELHRLLQARLTVPVDLIPDPGSLSLPEQCQLMRRYAVVITVSGSMSFACTFLPRGAAFIHIDYWDVNTGRSESLEGGIWQHFSTLMDMRYHVRKEEITPNVELSTADRARESARERTDLGPRSEWELWRNYGDVTIDGDRMWAAVRACMDHVALSWGAALREG